MATTESPSSSSFAMRFFGSSKANSRPSSRPASPARQKNITCRINVDSYGCFMMHRNRVDEQSLGTSTSVAPMFHDREISGVLEVEVPRGMGRRRCRSIKLTMRSVCRLNMGDKRGWEKDVLFNRGIEVKGAIILEEGVQRCVNARCRMRTHFLLTRFVSGLASPLSYPTHWRHTTSPPSGT